MRVCILETCSRHDTYSTNMCGALLIRTATGGYSGVIKFTLQAASQITALCGVGVVTGLV